MDKKKIHDFLFSPYKDDPDLFDFQQYEEVGIVLALIVSLLFLVGEIITLFNP